MDPKQLAATQFRVAGATRIVPRGAYPVVQLAPGTIIAPADGEPWLVLARLGGGGHGEVWRALPLATVYALSHPDLGVLPKVPAEGAIWQCDTRTVAALADFAGGEPCAAVKVLHMSQIPEQFHSEMVARLAREAHVCGTANQPQIPKLLAFRRRPIPFIAMELVEGETLEDYLDRIRGERGYVPWTTISAVLGDIFDALAVIHAMGVVHRDLKPSNLMMTRAGWRQVLKLIDFGIAKLLPEEQMGAAVAPRVSGATSGGSRARRAMMDQLQSAVGTLSVFTPLYAAPEQHEPPGRQTVSYATDFYPIGCMLYEMVTGRLWLPETTDVNEIRRQMVRPVPEIRHQDLGPKTRVFLRLFLQWLLQPLQEHRPQSVQEALSGSQDHPTLVTVRREHRAEGGPPPLPPDA